MTNRQALYEADLVARRYGVLPSDRLGFHALFSDHICYEVDKACARFGEWVDGRRLERTKQGKGSVAKYQTMAELLGITEEARRGGRTNAERRSVAEAYNEACRVAMVAGAEMPDIVTFVAAWEKAQSRD